MRVAVIALALLALAVVPSASADEAADEQALAGAIRSRGR